MSGQIATTVKEIVEAKLTDEIILEGIRSELRAKLKETEKRKKKKRATPLGGR